MSLSRNKNYFISTTISIENKNIALKLNNKYSKLNTF